MKTAIIGLTVVASLLSEATLFGQTETRLQLMDVNGRTLVIEPAALTTSQSITVPNVTGTAFIVPATGGGGTANQLTRFGTTTGTLLDGSLSDDGAGTLSRAGSLTLSVSSLRVTGQTTLNSGTGGSYSLPTSYGRNLDVLTSNGAGATSFNPVPPVGAIVMHATGNAPSGYLMCDGSAVSRTTYADLFAVIGTTYGAGNGSTTFNLPDFRGRAAIGAGTGSGLTNRALGSTGGQEVITTVPPHTHSATTGAHSHTANVNDPTHAHNVGNTLSYYWNTRVDVDVSAGELNLDATQTDYTTYESTGITVGIDTRTTGITINDTGTNNSAASVNVMNPSVVVNYVIKF